MKDYLSDSLIISKECSKEKPKDRHVRPATEENSSEPKEVEQDVISKLTLPDEPLKSSERSIFTLGNIKAIQNERSKLITQDVIANGKKLILRVSLNCNNS